MNQKKNLEVLFDRSKTHANIGTIGHVNHGEASWTEEAIKTVLGKRGECVSCKGRFQYNEQIYRDFNNHMHCEACYKEKYDDFN